MAPNEWPVCLSVRMWVWRWLSPSSPLGVSVFPATTRRNSPGCFLRHAKSLNSLSTSGTRTSPTWNQSGKQRTSIKNPTTQRNASGMLNNTHKWRHTHTHWDVRLSVRPSGTSMLWRLDPLSSPPTYPEKCCGLQRNWMANWKLKTDTATVS